MRKKGRGWWSLSASVAVGALGILAIFLLAWHCTEASWYDTMSGAEKANFWAQFFVAWGTTALALVTWASVYETQRVISGEDERFQQSRVPVVTIAEQATMWVRVTNGALVQFRFENVGDGAALNVRLTLRFAASYRMRVDEQHTGPNPNLGLQKVGLRDHLLFSYLPTRTPRAWDFQLTELAGFNATQMEINLGFQEVRLTFEDAFHNKFQVLYLAFPVEPENFIWSRV